jgi:topoisomerase-4 subunit A
MNVLDADRTPRVMGLKEVISAWIAHQFEVLVRRSQHRIAKIEDRVELLEGYLVAYLNLDRVIQIIREEDEPKAVMIAEFALTDRQAEAILNMRLRSLRKLEEMQIKKERDALIKERDELVKLVGSRDRQRTRLKKREPITVIMSQRGWLRAMKGHVDLSNPEAMKFKEGDGPRYFFHAQTTDKILLASSGGRFYTLGADRLPGGRGFGEPVRLMVDIEGEGDIAALFPAVSGTKLLLASSDGRGFVTSAAGAIAETRKGKQVVNLRPGAKLTVIRAVKPEDDYLAAIGDNRKMVAFPLTELPEMTRGAGVQIQRYRDGGLSDARTFRFADGISWSMGGDTGRTRTEADLNPWRTARGAAGRMAPLGFPKTNRFDPDKKA